MSVWKNVYDNAVKSAAPCRWEQLVKEFEKSIATDDKHSVPLFNLTRFAINGSSPELIVKDKVFGGDAPQRVQANVAAVDALIIDYDNDSLLQNPWTMAAVADKFKDYTFLMYSSHSYWKNHPAIEKFRLILPFSKSMPVTSYQDDWIPYVAAIKRFVGYVEPEKLPEEFQAPNEDTGRVAEHRLFGWLQVDEVLAVGEDPKSALRSYPWLISHPHMATGWAANNTVYVARERLAMPGRAVDLPGFGMLSRGLRLTAPGSTLPSIWAVPPWLDPLAGRNRPDVPSGRKVESRWHAAVGRQGPRVCGGHWRAAGFPRLVPTGSWGRIEGLACEYTPTSSRSMLGQHRTTIGRS